MSSARPSEGGRKVPTRVVLGIDAAWTPHEPSGVALAVEDEGGWRLHTAEASYSAFISKAHGQPYAEKHAGSAVTAQELIDATVSLVDVAPNVVAIDLPLSLQPISGRRCADTAVSRAFGGKGCATHSPTQERPGPISERLRDGFESAGYPLCIAEINTPGLMEVYPHPALVQLAGEDYRLPYKMSKVRRYWPRLAQADRISMLKAEWEGIATVLEPYLSGTCERLGSLQATGRKDLKALEDMLDAAICCVSGIRALEGAADAYGCDTSAIWVPSADPDIQARTLLPSSPYSARADLRAELFADSLATGGFSQLRRPSKEPPLE